MKIHQRTIGMGYPTYVIAEMSGNHNKSLSRAKEIIYAMKEGGADAVKLQTYTPDTLTIKSDRKEFRVGKGTMWEGQSLYDLYSEAFTPWEWHPTLKELANQLGMDLFSTPFDDTAVVFLEELEVPAYKVASFEIVDLALIRCIASTGKPMIMSTGMASKEEIREAVHAARKGGATNIALLKCTSAYPTPPEESNLRTMADLQKTFKVPIGLSDHTLGIAVPVAAVSLGACIVEKHFTMDRSEPGPDNAFSLEPKEFKAMVDAIRVTEKALGTVSYGTTKKEKASLVFRRSLFVVEDMSAGDALTTENVRSIRPGYGLPPKYLPDILGKKVKKAIKRGTPLDWTLVSS